MNYKCDTDVMVCFYEQEFYVLSNFSSFKLLWKGILFDTSEAAYQWEKFPEALRVRSGILYAMSAHDAFKIAGANTHLRRKDWDDVKADIMLEILRKKVEQHPYVAKKLLETGYRVLVEDSWRDDYWGWGPHKNGINMLGELWMEVRQEVREEE